MPAVCVGKADDLAVALRGVVTVLPCIMGHLKLSRCSSLCFGFVYYPGALYGDSLHLPLLTYSFATIVGARVFAVRAPRRSAW